MKKQLKIINKLFLIIKEIFYGIKSLLFKNKDIISGEEIVEYTKNKIVNDENFEKLLEIKKFRKLNNIYYVWDYNEYFKKLIFNYKYKRKIKIAKLISELIQREFYYVLCHGLLHILGYDHIEEEDKKIMRAKEEYYLSKFDLKRD